MIAGRGAQFSMVAAKTEASAELVLERGRELTRALRAGAPEALDQLQEYTECFEAWQKGWKKGAAGAVKLSRAEVELGNRIAKQHATVIGLAEELMGSFEQSLKNLRGWSKGLRAYIDHYPKRLGTIKPRKG
jgi:hypothetical protein